MRDVSEKPDRHHAWVARARNQFLQASQSSGRFGGSSNAPGAGPMVDAWSPLVPGYEILRSVYRGGQGVVYEARQQSTGRRVAIKLLREGPYSGENDRVRFEREVAILGQLNHRNIVGILDRSTSSGSHYLVMDYIDGRPLDRYAAENGLGLRARLQLFVAVCDAVTAAHQRGVIHRDLKPSNILIDPAGDPHVLDFGLAKDTADDGKHATMTGQFVGSLPWASPEQAFGRLHEVDMRSDVYSLGVVLYQLLTQQFPYSTVGDLDVALANIREAQPVRPSAMAAELDDDLDTIILKSLNKEPSRRYQSVGELARDVRHYLSGEPIEAKRDSLPYVLKKTLARHRGAVAVSILCLAVLAVSTIVSTSLWQQAERERDAATVAAAHEQKARQEADEEAAKARAVNEFLQTMLSSADPEISAVQDMSVRQVLDEASRSVDNGSLSGQPGVEAAARMTLGRSFLSLAQFDVAQRHFERAMQLVASTEGEESEAFAESLRWMGVLHRRRDNLVEAEKLQRRALALFQRVHPGDHPLTGHSMAELALVIEGRGSRDEAVAMTREAIGMLSRTLGPNDLSVASMESVLAFRTHDHVEGVRLAERSLNILRAAHGNQHPTVVRAMRRLAGMKFSTGARDEAQMLYEEGLEFSRGVFGDAHPETLSFVGDLSFLYRVQRARDKAIALQEAFLPAADRVFGPESRFRINHLLDRAEHEFSNGDVDAAEASYRKAGELVNRLGESDSVYESTVKAGLVRVLLKRGDCQQASTHMERARRIVDANPDAKAPGEEGRVTILEGEVAMCLGHYAEAEKRLLAGLELLKKSTLSGPHAKRSAMEKLSRLYEAWDAAEPGQGHQNQAMQWRSQISAIQPGLP